jgi:hypothetical protein
VQINNPGNSSNLYRNIVIGLLRALLILALIGAAWFFYHRLPINKAARQSNEPGETLLKIVLKRTSDKEANSMSIPIELYPIDVSAAQREFLSEHRPGQRFEDFLAQRMKAEAPKTELDQQGQTIIKIKPGKWWIHASFNGAQELIWRLPINVSGREQTVELTPENIYTRTKRF